MRKIASTLLIAALTTTALAGCGLRAGGGNETELTAMAPEEAALAAIGYHAEDPPPAGRDWVREHLLHGELVVQTDGGTRTVLVQRGEVTAVSDNTVTVTSTDGLAQRWTYGEALRVVEARTTVDPAALSIGTGVGVAGHDRAGTPVANLIVIPAQ